MVVGWVGRCQGPDLCYGLLPTFPHNAPCSSADQQSCQQSRVGLVLAAEQRVKLLPSFSKPANWVCSQQRRKDEKILAIQDF